MALRVNLPVTPIGIPLDTAYARVVGFFGEKDKAIIDVSVFASQAAREAGALAIATVRYHAAGLPTVTGDAPASMMAALYEALKAGTAVNQATGRVDDFKDAIDV